MTHVKAKPKEDSLKIDEVQDAMKFNLDQTKEQWINAELFEKIKKSPKLMAAFADPQMNKILQELSTNPTGIMQKYGSHPQFKEVIYEFGTMMRQHFGEMGKKAEEEAQRQEQAKKEAQEKYYREGGLSLLELCKKDPEIKAAIADPAVQAAIHTMQTKGGIDLYEFRRKDP